jgi:hypothetical protein
VVEFASSKSVTVMSSAQVYEVLGSLGLSVSVKLKDQVANGLTSL